MEDHCTTEVLPPLPATQADESSESSEDVILSGTAKRLSFAHLLQASAPSRPGPRPVSNSSQRSSTLPSRPTGVSFHSSLSSNASRPSETCRFDVKLQVEPSKNTFQEVRRTALDFFSSLTDADSKVKLHPWDPEQSTASPISSIDQLTTYPAFITYFRSRGGARANGGSTHWSVNLELSIPVVDLLSHLRYTLGGAGHGLYKRGLQVPECTCIGWLLHSTNEINKEELALQLSSYVNTPVDVRWRAIYTGSGFKRGQVSDDGPVRALHIEVAQDAARSAKSLLRKMYGVNPDPHTPPVLGLRMRLVPEVNRLTNLHSVSKATRLRERQHAWCKHAVRITNWEISQLDFVDAELDCSLRHILMSLHSTEPGYENRKLFFAVEHRYWSQEGGFVFVVAPKFADEARMTIAGLLPYLKYLAVSNQQNPDRVEGFFTTEAVERLAGAYYDPARREVVSEDEGILDEIEACDEDLLLDLTQMLTDKATVDTSMPPSLAEPAPQRPQPSAIAGRTMISESDSVTTFNTRTASKATASKTRSTSSDRSTSSASVFTAADRSEIQSLHAASQQTQTDIKDLKNSVQQLVTAFASFSTPRAGQPEDSVTPSAGSSSAGAGAGLQ